MSFESYDALKAEVQSFLWDRTDTIAKVPTFISLAEAEMKRLLKTQQAVLTRPISVSSGIGSLPTHSRQVLSVTLTDPNGAGTFDLDYATPEALAQWSVVSAQRPRFYTIEGDRFRFLPEPDQTYSGTVRYRAAFDPLSDTNTSNWVLERHPDIYLAGALKYAKMWLIDADQDWASVFYGAIDQANRDTPMRQANSRLRADEATFMGSRRGGYNVYTDGYGGR